MKNVDELYKKYYAYKNDYDTDDELNGSKKKKFDYSLNLLIKQINSQNQIKKRKKVFKEIEN